MPNPHPVPANWLITQEPDPVLCAAGCTHTEPVDLFPKIARCGNCGAEWEPVKGEGDDD